MRVPLLSMSLRNGVILGVLAPLVAVLGVGGVFVLGALERQLEAGLQDDIAVIARTLRVPLARSLERRRSYSLDSALRSTSDFERVYGVYVYDSAGRPIARAGQQASDGVAALEQLDVPERETTADYRSMDGREVYSVFTPLTDSVGNSIGMLQVTRRASEIRDTLSTLRRNAAIVILAGFAVSFGIVIAGHQFVIGRPLQRLADAMTRVGGGDSRARATSTGPKEIRWLASRFNEMLDKLVERDRVLVSERARQAQLEDRLRQSEKHAYVGRLASGVAHELGAPLNVVDGHAHTLLRTLRADARDRERLQRIRESTARMTTIVRQLLGFGRESALDRGAVTVARLVQIAVADLQSRFDELGVTLEVAPGPDDARVDVDSGRMRECLAHLLKNALYASSGGPVRIGWACPAPGETRIFVEDAGPGIPEPDRQRIFEPFFTTKPAGAGSGLGLAIVQGIVADHGAAVGVYESSLGGAGFEIVFAGAAT